MINWKQQKELARTLSEEPVQPRPIRARRRGRVLSARDACVDRARLGLPKLEVDAGWRVHSNAMHRYEPAISLFAQDGWSDRDLWLAVTGQDSPPVTIYASGVIAIALAGHMLAVMGDPPFVNPFFRDGVRTDLGARYDSGFPMLNVAYWKSGLAVQFHRRYCKLNG